MTTPHGLKVLFVAGFGPIVENAAPSKALYADALALPLLSSPDEPDYLHTDKVNGVRHFALWPLASAARSCFGADVWPAEMPKPTAWIEFDVEDVRQASDALQQRGYRLLVDSRTEPWGQTVTRFLSPEGLLVGLTFTPWMR